MLRTSYRITTMVGARAAPDRQPDDGRCSIRRRGRFSPGIGVALIGIGMGLTNNTFTVAIQGSVGWAQRGVATSTMSFMRQVGQSIGAAVFGGTINAELAERGASADIVDRIMDPALRRTLGARRDRAADAGDRHRACTMSISSPRCCAWRCLRPR